MREIKTYSDKTVETVKQQNSETLKEQNGENGEKTKHLEIEQWPASIVEKNT